jgi:hypothetical protein
MSEEKYVTFCETGGKSINVTARDLRFLVKELAEKTTSRGKKQA